ncbi:MAG: inorganic phosphate transporter [Bacteroidales bacterium]|nr:inorganic phosphate transporter [Bacteroidales bacterium]
METFYIIVIVILFLLAISDLIIGVSNDAVNFLNSAIGSKVASFRTIMIIAGAGVLVGATFSSGMMEVARKGIIHPDQFYFSEIMLIFLAVMLTDIILLDFYNTFGLPTSTTVSIVFELLGASVALATIKMHVLGQPLSEMSTYINSASAMIIIFGILLSVVIAFVVGAIVQYLSRILFSFNLKNTYKRYGGIFGGLAIAIILYFILIKGARGASFMTDASVLWVKENTLGILAVSFVGWSLILQFLIWFTRINIFKVIVLAGTFSLAMAFAGNDLVNFIGVPLAGLESFKTYLATEGSNPDGLLMTALQGKIHTPTVYLLAAGLIMVATLFFSRKARSVTRTTIDLSRQEAGYERFESTGFSRALVRHSRVINEFIKKILPKRVLISVEQRFDRSGLTNSNQASFDLVRASVNLVVAAVLIAFATSLKLPLSTTYVTFMVAMGSSLSDRAWGRESAVYRITGVLVVIMGWFVTALLAFTSAFIMGYLIYYGKLPAILTLAALAIFLVVRSQMIHRKREEKLKRENDTDQSPTDQRSRLERSSSKIIDILSQYDRIYIDIITALQGEKRKKLQRLSNELSELNHSIKQLKLKIPETIRSLSDEEMDSGQAYIQILDFLGEANHCLLFIARPAFDHVSNNHQELNADQQSDLSAIGEMVTTLIQEALEMINNQNFEKLSSFATLQDSLLEQISRAEKRHLKRIKKGSIKTRNSVLYIGILRETRGLTLFLHNLTKAYANLLAHSSISTDGSPGHQEN